MSYAIFSCAQPIDYNEMIQIWNVYILEFISMLMQTLLVNLVCGHSYISMLY